MKSFLEWYLGIPPAAPGQGTQWTWLHEAPWPAWMPQWFVILLVPAGLIYIGWVYRKDARSAALTWRILLTGLRLTVIAFLLLMLTELTLVVDRTGLPFIAVLIDDSASMGLEDRYSDTKDRAAANAFLKDKSSGGSSRLAIAQSILTRQDGRFLRELQGRHQLRVYRFSQTAVPIGGLESDSDMGMQDLTAAIGQLTATGEDTRPAEAIRKVISDFRGSLPSAIVVLSDGISSTGDGDRLTVGAELAAKRLVPIYAGAIGSEEAMHDLNLYDTLVDEVAFVSDPITVTAKLKAFGFKGKQAALTLREKGSAKPLTSKRVTVGDDGQTVPVEITWIPDEAGDFELVLEVKPQSSEVDKTNNSETRQVSVREGRIRVLLVDSLPRWEFRELKAVLEREKTIDLHTVLQDADLEFADQDATAQPLRGRFPVNREQLFDYDVILFGDVELRYLSTTTLEQLQDFVGEAGGGLMMIAGPGFNPAGYADTPLETLLPIELEGLEVPDPDALIEIGFSPRLTLEGRKSTPIFRFDANESDSQAIWNNLPEMYWFVSAPSIKRGATVFVEHPNRMGNGRHLPIVVMQRFGAGKVIFHATDETWVWRQRVGDLYFGRYWIQAIRYLSRTRLLGQSKTAELKTDRLVYNRGETATLRVRFFNEEEVPKDDDAVKVMVERRGATTQEVVLTRVPQAPNAFEGELRRMVEGSYHAWVAQPPFDASPPATDFRVEAAERELAIRGLDRRQLSEAAALSRGKFYSLATVADLPGEVPRGRPVPIRSEEPIPIWNRWELLLLFTILLSTEWLLRKRLRLL